jgi:hypothetical protein
MKAFIIGVMAATAVFYLKAAAPRDIPFADGVVWHPLNFTAQAIGSRSVTLPVIAELISDIRVCLKGKEGPAKLNFSYQLQQFSDSNNSAVISAGAISLLDMSTVPKYECEFKNMTYFSLNDKCPLGVEKGYSVIDKCTGNLLESENRQCAVILCLEAPPHKLEVKGLSGSELPEMEVYVKTHSFDMVTRKKLHQYCPNDICLTLVPAYKSESSSLRPLFLRWLALL